MIETQDKLEVEEEKISDREIKSIKQILTKLERNLPKIQEEVDKLYYSCYEASQIVLRTTDPSKSPIYLIEPTKFVNYLEMVYGLNTARNI